MARNAFELETGLPRGDDWFVFELPGEGRAGLSGLREMPAVGDGQAGSLEGPAPLGAAEIAEAAETDDDEPGVERVWGTVATVTFEDGKLEHDFSADRERIERAPDLESSNLTLDQLIRLLQFLAERAAPEDFVSGTGANGVVSDFNITVDFKGRFWTDALVEDFVAAAEYLSSVITGDLPDVGGIDDVVIEARLSDIDGSGGILGQAGPTFVRSTGDQLPTQGIMEFDIADADNFDQQGLFDDIVLHEMQHVLGFGTLWDFKGLTQQVGTDLRFAGPNATAAYEAEFPGIAGVDPNSDLGVPVETDGGPGTAGGHWDEDTFDNELMTGFINGTNYISGMTLASLEDLGYDTVFDPNVPDAAVPQPDDIAIA